MQLPYSDTNSPPEGYGGQPQPTQQPAVPADPAVDQGMPNITGIRGFFYPRWALLAGMLLSVLAVVGFFIKSYYQMHVCAYGFLCTPDLWPSWVQIAIIWSFYLLMVFVSYVTGLGFLEVQNPNRPPVAQMLSELLRALSNFAPIHWLLMSFGSVAIIGIGAMIYWSHFNTLAFAYCGIIFYISVCAMIFNPRGNRQMTAQQQLAANNARAVGPRTILGTLPRLNRLIPNRPRRRDRRPPPAPQPVAVPGMNAQQPIIPGEGNL